MPERHRQVAEELLVAFRSGKEKAFDFFFRRYYAALCYYASRYIKHCPAAEDVVSESFIQLWNHREKIESENHLRNWLYKVVYHGCLRLRERQLAVSNGHKELNKISDEEEIEFFENIIKAETMRQLNEAMNQLPNQCRKIFFKLYIEGKSVKEVAEELKLTASTIKNQKARGIKLLRIRLSS